MGEAGIMFRVAMPVAAKPTGMDFHLSHTKRCDASLHAGFSGHRPALGGSFRNGLSPTLSSGCKALLVATFPAPPETPSGLSPP